MRTPRMTGRVGMTVDQEEHIWNLHVMHNMSGKAIATRMGMGEHKVCEFLKKRREERGVAVKIDSFPITRPLAT